MIFSCLMCVCVCSSTRYSYIFVINVSYIKSFTFFKILYFIYTNRTNVPIKIQGSQLTHHTQPFYSVSMIGRCCWESYISINSTLQKLLLVVLKEVLMLK